MDLAAHVRSNLLRDGYQLGEKLAIAYSGGIDSTALLLLALDALSSSRVMALHIDHSARETSHRDEAHCRAVASELGITYLHRKIERGKAHPLTQIHGLEGALRQLRYSILAEVCAEYHLRFLATGHTADDLLETHLLALMRGSGLTGLAGPRAWRQLSGEVRLLRPLLDLSRKRLISYLASHHPDIPTVEDATNLDVSMARNRLRHRIIPELIEMAGSPLPLYRGAKQLREDRYALETLIRQRQEELGIDPEGEHLDLSGTRDLSDPAITAAIRTFVARRFSGFPPPKHTVERIHRALSEPGRTRWIDIPQGRLRIERHRLLVETAPPSPIPPQTITIGDPIYSEAFGISLLAEIRPGSSPPLLVESPHRVEFDLAALGSETIQNLVLRAARPGDRFRPFGLNGSTRLFRWLAGQGVSRVARRSVPVVVSGEEVLWVIPLRRGDQAPITDETVQRLYLSVREGKEG